MTSLPQRLTVWALDEEVPGTIPVTSNFENDFFRISSGLGVLGVPVVNFIDVVFIA